MKLRMRFGKEGMVKFIGHLDIMRYFQKAFRRAGFDLRYSQGFSPHPYLSFAAPLGVGLESSGEYLDMEVNSCGDLDEMLIALNKEMVEGIHVYNIIALPDDAKTSMAIVAAADYEIFFRDGMSPCDTQTLRTSVENFMASASIPVLKKTKKSEREIDIRPLIYSMYVTDAGSIFLQAASGSVANLKPELILQTLYEQMGWSVDPYAWLIWRRNMYADAGNEQKGRRLVSLDAFTA